LVGVGSYPSFLQDRGSYSVAAVFCGISDSPFPPVLNARLCETVLLIAALFCSTFLRMFVPSPAEDHLVNSVNSSFYGGPSRADQE